MLQYGSMVNLYVSPGDSIFIEMNGKFLYADSLHLNKCDLLKVQCTTSKINTEILKYQRYISDSLFNLTEENKAIKKYNPDQYTTYIKNRTKKYNEYLRKFNSESITSKEFQNWACYDLQYGAFNDLMRYRWLHPIYNNLEPDSLGRFPFEIPKKYFDFLKSENNGNIKAIVATKYINFIQEYSTYLKYYSIPLDTLQKLKLLSKVKYAESNLVFIRHLNKNSSGFAKDLILSNLYYQLLKSGDLDVYEKVSELNPIANQILASVIKSKFVSSSVSNQPSSLNDSHLNIISDSAVNPIFDTLTKRFAGNVLYIDFWAPWCSPCMSEIPKSLQIQQEFATKDIIFIYLANRCTERSWKATIIEKKITGEHFLLTDDQYKSFVNQFKITGIPHYVLVDKSGQISTTDAPRPSNYVRLKEMIQTLLDKN